MGAHKNLMEEAIEELADQFRRAGMDRLPSEAEIRQRVKELVEETMDEPIGKEIWLKNRPIKS